MERNVLIVEDQKNLSKALVAILEHEGYAVDAVYNGNDGLSYARLGAYDAIVLDVMLPGMDGFEIVKTLRREGVDVPVIMLTARTTLGDKVTGLDLGADDYLTKPFQPAELLARLRALTRRSGTVAAQTLTLGNTMLDLETCDLCVAGSTNSGEQTVHLSQREFDVCQILMANPGQAISKSRLLERIWGMDSDADENSVEAYVSFVRKKLAFLGSNLKIETLRMIGYRIDQVEPTQLDDPVFPAEKDAPANA
jgi:DNA-binding response OmpR family regulator